MTPDTRRAVRTCIHAFGALAMLAMLVWIIDKLPPEYLQALALGLIGILGLREVFHGAENITARIKLSASPTGADVEIEPGGEG